MGAIGAGNSETEDCLVGSVCMLLGTIPTVFFCPGGTIVPIHAGTPGFPGPV